MKKITVHNDCFGFNTRKSAFSLAEMMVVLLIMTIVLAMTMPIISKRVKAKPSLSAFSDLPIRAEGDDCPDPVNGQLQNNLAITADRSTLLMCMQEATSGGTCSDIGAQAAQWDSTNKIMTRLVCKDE